MSPNIIEQLKIVQQIAEAEQAGNPIEWEVNDNEIHPDEFVAYVCLDDAICFLHPPGRYAIRLRTTRPIPVPDKWAKEKAAFAEGKVIQSRWLKSEIGCWLDNDSPAWLDNHDYRIKPEPVMVELGPEDIEPGSCIRLPSWQPGEWDMITEVDWSAACIGPCATNLNWTELKSDGWLIHRPSKPGAWEKCEKEVEP